MEDAVWRMRCGGCGVEDAVWRQNGGGRNMEKEGSSKAERSTKKQFLRVEMYF